MGNAFDNASHPMFDLGGGNYGGIDPALLGYTHYVSNVGVATWANATEITTPCSITTAVAQATPGSVVGVRGGTYDVGNNGGGDLWNGAIQVTVSGTQASPIIFKAYEGEVPVFDGTIVGNGDWGTNGNVGCYVLVITGLSVKEYITLDGFVFQSDSGVEMAGITVGDGDGNNDGPSGQYVQHITVQNCTFKGGSNTPALQDNSAAIRLNKSNNCSILNNRFENYTNSNPSYLDSYPMGILSYSGYDHTIANNEFYDSVVGVGMKSGNDGWDIYDNFFYECRVGVKGYTATRHCSNTLVHNNIVANFAEGGISIAGASGVITGGQVYNNTVYASGLPVSAALAITEGGLGSTGVSSYNNVLWGKATAGFLQTCHYDNDATFANIDYNIYAGSDAVVMVGGTGPTFHSTLVSLQADDITGLPSPNHNQNSLFREDPVFTNGNGDLSAPSDFALAAGSPGKDADSLGNDMGADVTTVGIQ